jgi:5-methylcytosine-specific restriction endonuclease McrA
MPNAPKSYAQLRKVEKAYRPKREYDNMRANNTRWRKVRELVLARNPLCADPFKLHNPAILAKEVHHIVPLEVDKSLCYVMSNLVGMCQSCHARCDAMARVDLDRQVRLFK